MYPADKLCCCIFLLFLGCIGVRCRQDRGRQRSSRTPAGSVVQVYNNSTGAEAHNGGHVTYNGGYPVHPDISQFECKELRSKRYISDGFCTSFKPVTEVVCAGNCLPLEKLPWYAEYMKVISRKKTAEFRCVEDNVRRKRVKLLCEDGGTRTYRIKVVKTCKCKRYKRKHNETNGPQPKKSNRKTRRRRRRKQRSRVNKTGNSRA